MAKDNNLWTKFSNVENKWRPDDIDDLRCD